MQRDCWCFKNTFQNGPKSWNLLKVPERETKHNSFSGFRTLRCNVHIPDEKRKVKKEKSTHLATATRCLIATETEVMRLYGLLKS